VFTLNIIQGYYDGSVFVPLVPVNVKINQPVLITVLETANQNADKNRFDKFFGALSVEDYCEITEALKDTEKVDINEW